MRGPRTTMKSGPRLPQLEKALAQRRRPNTAINKNKKEGQTRHGCLASLFPKMQENQTNIRRLSEDHIQEPLPGRSKRTLILSVADFCSNCPPGPAATNLGAKYEMQTKHKIPGYW